MAQVFSPRANRAPLLLAAIVAGCGLLGGVAVAYYFSPRYTDAGYQPRQPLPFSHRLHAGELSMDCRYCHTAVELSPVATLPPTQVCMNCHRLVGRRAESLALLRESDETGEPIHWIRVHDLPDYAYFDHSLHLRAGVGCVSCHGDVSSMEEIRQIEPLSMSWCLDCHRDPAPHLRERDSITSPAAPDPTEQPVFARRLIEELRIEPPTDCSGCHR